MPTTILHSADNATPAKPLASWYAPGLSDGLGDRLLMFDNSSAPSLELLRFRPDLADAPGFEAALREQVQRLAGFQHPAFARVRSVQRLEPDEDLALISNHTPGKRLSEVLHRARGPAFAAALIRQLAPALAQFQQQHPGAAHGLLNPHRIIVSPEARLTIVEHVVAPAIERLDLSTLPLGWMGITLPPASDGTPVRLDVATDWYQLGLVSLAALLGRPVTEDDLPQLERLLDQLSESTGRDGTPLSPFIRQWLDRTLQISGERIVSAADAREAMTELLQDDGPRDSARAVPVRLAPAADPLPAPPPAPAPVFPPTPVTEAFPVETRASFTPPALDDIFTPGPALDAFVPEEPKPRPARPAMRPPAAEVTAPIATPVSASVNAPVSAPVAPPLSAPAAAPISAPAAAPISASVAPPVSAPVSPSITAPLAPPSMFDARSRGVAEPALSPFEREVLAGRVAGPIGRVSGTSDVAKAGSGRTVSLAVAAGIALFAVVEAGVIAWMALTPTAGPAAVTVETTPAGEHVVSRAGDSQPPPMQLTLGPDLNWVRVTTSPTPGLVGGSSTAAASGTVRILSPISLKVLEGTRLLGSVPGPELKLPVGRHVLDLVNDALGYRLQQIVQVEAGQSLSVHVTPPPGSLTIDAAAGTEVSIDGQVAGRTPLAPLAVAPGEHQIVLRHPKVGSDRQRVTVKSAASSTVVARLR